MSLYYKVIIQTLRINVLLFAFESANETQCNYNPDVETRRIVSLCPAESIDL